MTGEPALSRRSALRIVCGSAMFAVGGAGLAGCTSSPPRQRNDQPPVSVTNASADVHLLTQALADEARLLTFCDGAAARHPSLAGALAPVSAVQRSHVAKMQRALGRPPIGHVSVPVPRRPAAARARLLQELRRTHLRRTKDCGSAESGALACLFASVGASHAMTLGALSGT